MLRCRPSPCHDVVELLLLLLYLSLLLHGLQLGAQRGHLLLDGGGGEGLVLLLLLWWQGYDGEAEDVQAAGGAGLLDREEALLHAHRALARLTRVK